MTSQLAIIIPAYKEKFLEKTLISLVNQTNKDFNVYVGDDNSPYDLKSICDKFASVLNIEYVKFENNIGAKNIIEQWDRCIALSKNETWIWLFSDDDIADVACVDLFYSTIKKDNAYFDVYRFNTRVINDNDQIIGESVESPTVDTSVNMAYNILMGNRGNSMPDHIFSRVIYEKYGFVKTDWAQGADWATSIQFASDKGIYTIPGAKVNWRLSSMNISGTVQCEREKKIRGHLQCLSWIINYFQFLEIRPIEGISYQNVLNATYINLESVIGYHYKGLSLMNFGDLYNFFRKKNIIYRALRKTVGIYYRVYRKKWGV
jgi:glycosyltransferase involved in cell wall biosynthesis